MTDAERLSHALMRASIAEGKAKVLQADVDYLRKELAESQERASLWKRELDRVVAML